MALLASSSLLARLSGVRSAFVNTSVRAMSSSIQCKRLNGKVAIVTASTDGIGYSIAKRLAQEGASVYISSRKEANVKNAVDTLRSEGLDVDGCVCHVGKKEDRSRLFDMVQDKHGGLDFLVSNAAVNPSFGPTIDTPEEAWDKIFEVNVKASFLLTKEALPLIERRGGGSVIYISSVGGYQGFHGIGAYSISKTALLGLTKVLATELAPNIRVNCICPGVIKTNFSKAMTDIEGGEDLIKSITPLNRLGKPDEIAGAAAFLCSDDASYVTGESIVIAGGFFTRL